MNCSRSASGNFRNTARRSSETVAQQFKWLDAQIGNKPFIASDRFTIADITAEVAVDFGVQAAGVPMDPALKNLARWHQSVSSRPSAKA
jgi:glutathione S-transferase